MSETADPEKNGGPVTRRRRRHRRRPMGGRRGLVAIALLGLAAVLALSFVFYEIFSSIDF